MRLVFKTRNDHIRFVLWGTKTNRDNWIGQNSPNQLRKISTHNQRSVQTHMNIDDMISVSFGRRRGVKDWLQRVCYALGAWLAQEDALEVVGLPPLRRREDFWKVLRCSRNDYWSSLWNSHHHSSTSSMMSSARVSFRLVVPAKGRWWLKKFVEVLHHFDVGEESTLSPTIVAL